MIVSVPDPDGASVFDHAAPTYDRDEHHAVVASALVAGVRLPAPPSLVIDAGTGTGFAALAALQWLAPARIIAIDVSARMLERAKAKAAEQDPTKVITWRAESAVPLRVDRHSADLVLCSSSLHFLGGVALRDWLRILRPGGKAGFTLPHAEDFRPSRSVRRLMASDLDALLPEDDTSAVQIATAAGFEQVVVETVAGAAAAGDRPRRTFLIWAEAPAAEASRPRPAPPPGRPRSRRT